MRKVVRRSRLVTIDLSRLSPDPFAEKDLLMCVDDRVCRRGFESQSALGALDFGSVSDLCGVIVDTSGQAMQETARQMSARAVHVSFDFLSFD